MQNSSLSFAELEKKENVSPEELKTTLKNYVDTWAAILWSVVIWLLKRTQMTQTDLLDCFQTTQKWASRQYRICRDKKSKEENAWEYLQVVNHIEDLLHAKA